MANGKEITRATNLPAINLGLAVALIGFLWVLAGDVREAQVVLAATYARQTKYIVRRNDQHRATEVEIHGLKDTVHDLELEIVRLQAGPGR